MNHINLFDMKHIVLLLILAFCPLWVTAQHSAKAPVIIDIVSDWEQESEKNYCFDLSNNIFLEAQTIVIGGDIPDIFYIVAIKNGIPLFAFVDWKEKWVKAERGWLVILDDERYHLVVPDNKVSVKEQKKKTKKK